MGIKDTKRTSALRGCAALAGLALAIGLAPAPSLADDGHGGAVYVMSNQAPANSILVYSRTADGSLTYANSVPTGGAGLGTGGDPLGSQGALTLASGVLLAVNAGSNDVSMFDADGTALTLLDRVSSGGQRPVSIAAHGLLVYVLNSPAAGVPNISGFVIDPFRHHLVPLPQSQRPLAGGAAAAAAEVSFSADGRVLIVTEKGTQSIDTYTVDHRGYASAPTAHVSSGSTPFGFSVTRRGFAFVSEAAAGAASSYDVDDNGSFTLVSGSVSLLGEKAPCWLVTTRDGRFAYTANAGTGSIGSFSIAPNGTLTLVNPRASALAAPLDSAVSGDGRFLYVREGTGVVTGLRIAEDGTLTTINAAPGIPVGAQGIAAQ